MSKKYEPPQSRTGSIASLLQELDENGFIHNWRVIGDVLKSDRLQEMYHADKVSMVATYRFEGITDLQDEQIIYALQADDGTKGILIDAYGPYSDPKIAAFVETVKDARQDSGVQSSIPSTKVIEIKSNS